MQTSAFSDPFTEHMYSGPTTKLAFGNGEWIVVEDTIVLSIQHLKRSQRLQYQQMEI
jgi:hypothetical protein